MTSFFGFIEGSDGRTEIGPDGVVEEPARSGVAEASSGDSEEEEE